MEHPDFVRQLEAAGCRCVWWTDLQGTVRSHWARCPVHEHPDMVEGQMVMYARADGWEA